MITDRPARELRPEDAVHSRSGIYFVSDARLLSNGTVQTTGILEGVVSGVAQIDFPADMLVAIERN